MGAQTNLFYPSRPFPYRRAPGIWESAPAKGKVRCEEVEVACAQDAI